MPRDHFNGHRSRSAFQGDRYENDTNRGAAHDRRQRPEQREALQIPPREVSRECHSSDRRRARRNCRSAKISATAAAASTEIHIRKLASHGVDREWRRVLGQFSFNLSIKEWRWLDNQFKRNANMQFIHLFAYSLSGFSHRVGGMI